MYKFTRNEQLRHALKELQYNSETKKYKSRYGNPYEWDISEITDMSNLFMLLIKTKEDCDKFRFIERWDVSHVTNMNNMFYQCNNLQLDLSGWNVSNVTNMKNMFAHCTNMFHNCGLYNWNVSNVTDMSSMFNSATNFNNDIDNWDVSNVENMNNMFQGVDLKRDLSKWKPESLVNADSMFYGDKIHPNTYEWYKDILKLFFLDKYRTQKNIFMKGTTRMSEPEVEQYNKEKRISDGNRRRGMAIMKELSKPKATRPIRPSAPKMTEEEYKQYLKENIIMPSAPEITQEEYEQHLIERERQMRALTHRPQNLGEYPVIPSMRIGNTIHEEYNPNEHIDIPPVRSSISGRDIHDDSTDFKAFLPKPPANRTNKTRKTTEKPSEESTPSQARINKLFKPTVTMRNRRGNSNSLPDAPTTYNLPDAPTHELYNLPKAPTDFSYENPNRQRIATKSGGNRRRNQRKTKRRNRKI